MTINNYVKSLLGIFLLSALFTVFAATNIVPILDDQPSFCINYEKKDSPGLKVKQLLPSKKVCLVYSDRDLLEAQKEGSLIRAASFVVSGSVNKNIKALVAYSVIKRICSFFFLFKVNDWNLEKVFWQQVVSYDNKLSTDKEESLKLPDILRSAGTNFAQVYYLKKVKRLMFNFIHLDTYIILKGDLYIHEKNNNNAKC